VGAWVGSPGHRGRGGSRCQQLATGGEPNATARLRGACQRIEPRSKLGPATHHCPRQRVLLAVQEAAGLVKLQELHLELGAGLDGKRHPAPRGRGGAKEGRGRRGRAAMGLAGRGTREGFLPAAHSTRGPGPAAAQPRSRPPPGAVGVGHDAVVRAERLALQRAAEARFAQSAQVGGVLGGGGRARERGGTEAGGQRGAGSGVLDSRRAAGADARHRAAFEGTRPFHRRP
jgi:hypothetical protein